MYKKFLFVVILFSFGGVGFAQNADLTVTLNKLFKYSKTRSFSQASALILYKGKDVKRNLKSPYDYSKPSEKKEVDRICKRIRKYLLISDSYSIAKKVEFNKTTKEYTVIVQFKSGSQKLGIGFVFIKIKDKFLLSKIE
jgi:hypothetical protein